MDGRLSYDGLVMELWGRCRSTYRTKSTLVFVLIACLLSPIHLSSLSNFLWIMFLDLQRMFI